jgi:murein DD-endopeptidase MepM/ murein hydrolase activator NlpD
VSSRKIVQPFGRYVNPATKVATDNIGIGIGIPAGSAVRCAWEGRVSLVHWLPGYGSLVIVEHAGDYRTVYANLSSVMVTEGQRLGRGEVVGRSGRATDGEYVHFEVWHNTNLLNPGEWLQ